MNRGIKKQVHPAVAAVIVIAVLIAVQYAWWKGLVHHEYSPNAPRGGGAPAGPPPVTTVLGRQDVTVDTLAGDLEPGEADGPGHAARFDRPTGLAIDGQGNLYVADTGNHRIRKIAPDGTTTTVAGSTVGYADGPAGQAKFNAPCGVTVAADGTVYVADTGNEKLRRISEGQVATINTADGNDTTAPHAVRVQPVSIAFSGGIFGGLYVGDSMTKGLTVFRPDGRRAVLPGGGRVYTSWPPHKVDGVPTGIAIAESGRCALATPGSGRISTSLGEFTNLPIGGETLPKLAIHRPICIYPMGNEWLVTDANHPAVLLVHDGTAEVLAGVCSSAEPMRGSRDGDGSKAQFSIVSGVVTDGKGHVYVADTANNMIRRITL